MKVTKVKLKCVGCNAIRIVEEMPTEQPMCEKCYMPMILESVRARKAKS